MVTFASIIGPRNSSATISIDLIKDAIFLELLYSGENVYQEPTEAQIEEWKEYLWSTM